MTRYRRTKAQIAQLREQILEVLRADHPQSVRHIFYRMTDPRLPEPVPKTDKGYGVVQRQLVQMRREEVVPYHWITDSTRRGYFVETYSGVRNFLEDVATLYRRDIWRRADTYVEVWCESRSIAGVLMEETERYRVPLYPSGGFTSLSLAHQAAGFMAADAGGRPIRVLYIGDYDPAGLLINDHIERELREHLPSGVDLTVDRLAVTREQIDLMGLPAKPTKDRRARWEGGCVEAEAIHAATLRAILRNAIEEHIDQRELEVVLAAEKSEREGILAMAEGWER